MADDEYLNHTLLESRNLDRKSLDSRTKFTATTTSSNGSLSEKKKLESLRNERERRTIMNSSHGNKYEDSVGSGFDSPTSKDSAAVKNIISSLRRSKYNSRATSEGRSGRTPSKSRYAHKYNVDAGRSRMHQETPRSYRTTNSSPTPRRSRITDDYFKIDSSSSRHREKLKELLAREEMDFEEEHFNSRHKGRRGNMEDLRSRSTSRLRELVSREEGLSSALLRNNIRDIIGDEMGRHDDYKYSKYSRRERGDHQRESSRNDRKYKEKISNLTFKNEDLKKTNHKIRKEIEDMKIRMGEVIEYSMFFKVNENGEQTSQNEGLKKMAKALYALKNHNTELEAEIDELKGTVTQLQDVTQGHEETIEIFQDQEEDQETELQEKNELILVLEKDRDTLQRYLRESQIENKIIKKKANTLEQKIGQLENGDSRKKNSHSLKKKDLYVHPPPNDETTVSSLED